MRLVGSLLITWHGRWHFAVYFNYMAPSVERECCNISCYFSLLLRAWVLTPSVPYKSCEYRRRSTVGLCYTVESRDDSNRRELKSELIIF